MIQRRHFLAFAAFATAPLFAARAQTNSATRFTPAAFQAAQAAGQPILVEVTAPWCPTCRAQKPILSELLRQPRFASVRVFEVDFDSQKDVLRTLNVRMQSTLVVFNGARETGRSTGDTNRTSIEALLATAV